MSELAVKCHKSSFVLCHCNTKYHKADRFMYFMSAKWNVRQSIVDTFSKLGDKCRAHLHEVIHGLCHSRSEEVLTSTWLWSYTRLQKCQRILANFSEKKLNYFFFNFRERCTCTTKYLSRMHRRNWSTTQSPSPLLQVKIKAIFGNILLGACHCRQISLDLKRWRYSSLWFHTTIHLGFLEGWVGLMV